MAYSIDAKNNITLVRGDYFPCMINMTKDDEPFTPMSGSLRFAVKKRYTDTDDKVLIRFLLILCYLSWKAKTRKI